MPDRIKCSTCITLCSRAMVLKQAYMGNFSARLDLGGEINSYDYLLHAKVEETLLLEGETIASSFFILRKLKLVGSNFLEVTVPVSSSQYPNFLWLRLTVRYILQLSYVSQPPNRSVQMN